MTARARDLAMTAVVRSAAILVALTLAFGAAHAANWSLTIDTPNRVAPAGTTVTFTGTITNGTGGDLAMNTSIEFFTSPESELFTADFAASFLTLNLVIPAAGYSGPLFEIEWDGQARPGTFGQGAFQISTGDPADPYTLAAPFTLRVPGYGPFCAEATGFPATASAVVSDDSTATPVIAYNEAVTGALEYATLSGTTWSTTTVAAGIGFNASPALVLDGELHPHIVYYDEVLGDLVHVWHDGAAWISTTVDAAGDVGRTPSMVRDELGDLHVAYYDAGHGHLKYARRSAGTWSVEKPDSIGLVGRFTSIAVDASGTPYISYYDEIPGNLKLARRLSGAWLTETVDAAGTVGQGTSIEVRDGTLFIAYRDATPGTPSLKFASGVPGSWGLEVVDTDGDPVSPVLDLNGFGQPQLAYFEAATELVRYATKPDGVTWDYGAVASAPAGAPALVAMGRTAADEPYVCYMDAGRVIQFASLSSCATTDVVDRAGDGPLLALFPNRPNPFTGTTVLSFSVARRADARVQIFDAAGRLVAEPLRRFVRPGVQRVEWTGSGRGGTRLPPGVYVYQVRVGSEVRRGRMVLLR